MNRPWMPLYAADYLADTAHLSAAESGAYLHLIMHYWVNGGLPTDDRLLARVARMTPAQWKVARLVIEPFFQEGWKHKRIEFELTEAARISAAGKAGGKASGQARRQRSPNDPRTTDERSLNDHSNDPPTIREALPSPSQPQKEERGSSLRSESSPRENWRAEFDQFWKAFPNKVGKQAAYKAFAIAMKSGAVTFDRMMFALDAYVNKTDDRPWCNPSTWLNQGRWDDQPAAGVPRNGRDNSKSICAAADRQLERLGGMEAARAYVPGSSGPQPLRLDFGEGKAGVRLIPKR